MKQQTAVEWLQEAISKKLTNEISPSFLDLFDQAKSMEKEQIMDAYYYEPNCGEIKDDGEQYYTETYQTF